MIKDFKVSEVYKHLSIHDDADTLQVYVYEDDGKPAPISIQEEEFIQAPSPGMRIRDVSNFILRRSKGYFFRIRFFDFPFKQRGEDLEFRVID